jgi:hypothetical protein
MLWCANIEAWIIAEIEAKLASLQFQSAVLFQISAETAAPL